MIEIPLNSYRYHFRRLTWSEELRLKFPPREDQRRIVLAHALVDVSGMATSPSDAMKILKSLPEALFWRIWLIYRADLPADRYYTSGGLYEAPDPMTYHQNLQTHEDATNRTADAAMSAVERQQMQTGTDALDISQRMFENARRSGQLTPARQESDAH